MRRVSLSGQIRTPRKCVDALDMFRGYVDSDTYPDIAKLFNAYTRHSRHNQHSRHNYFKKAMFKNVQQICCKISKMYNKYVVQHSCYLEGLTIQIHALY
jgi:hypothetical protein